MKLLLVTDAWQPQINGVVRTLSTIVHALADYGIKVEVCQPNLFSTIPCPGYPEIKLAIPFAIRRMVDRLCPDIVHIATEGPLGIAVKRYCDKRQIKYTTSFHTRFPEYLENYLIPRNLTYAYLKWFHKNAHRTLVPTPSMKESLERRGFKNIQLWTRGVDHDLFHPDYPDTFTDLPRPIFLNVGRVAAEKNLEPFLSAKLPGTKVLVGDGPQLRRYQASYPDVIFLGYKTGKDLAACFASADVFVFPSVTDTFGLVILEAMACGLPIMAYNVTGPKDIVTRETGILISETDHFVEACKRCLNIDRGACISHAKRYNWGNCISIFVNNLVNNSA